MSKLDSLLALQERDLALDRLRHRRDTLPEREALSTAEARVAELAASIERARSERDDIAREETRFEHEAQSLAEQATAAEQKLYSGEIASPRELQALQTDVEQLKRHQRGIEDRQIAAMERREPLDARITALAAELATASADATRASEALAAAETAVDQEAAGERAARDEVVAGITPELVSAYDAARVKANGVGAASLVGNTCQGCHLTIPSTEVERIKKAADGEVSHCDNCGTILVP